MTCPIQILTCVCLVCALIAREGAVSASELRPLLEWDEIEIPTIDGLEAKLHSYFCPPANKTGDPPGVLFPDSPPELLFDALQDRKREYHIPMSAEAWHWEHLNNGGSLGSGYGIPGIRGTYFWALKADPEMEIDSNGWLQKIGGHAELRLREQDHFRSFFPNKVWFWELYAWADTPVGRFKAGQIWRRFGLDWDGSFFGNIPFFDGYKLNPDYGVSWENTWTDSDDFKMDSYAQFFIHEDGINGTVAGTDSESLAGTSQRNTGVVRLVPTWTLSDDSTIALGVSGLTGEIVNNPRFVTVPHQSLGAWALDVTYTRSRWKFFAEALQSYGVRSPERFVSGGPSNRTTDVLTGIHYKLGPATYRVNYSAGFDDNPYGWQQMWVPGVTVALTKNVDFYIDYVRWDVYNNATAPNGHLNIEDGFSFVINWRL